jgi:hypothetical protein
MLKQTFKYLQVSVFFTLTILLFAQCSKDETNSKNHLPVAGYLVNPYRGDVNTVFQFSAADSVSDNEDAVDVLEVRWDWNNDGIYDTEYSANKTITHQYSQSGLYFPVLKVRDTKGMVDSVKKMLVVALDLSNEPPYDPINLSPPDWQSWMEPSVIFKWKCTDPKGDDLTFDLWLGKTVATMKLVQTGITDFEINNNIKEFKSTITGLELNKTTYFWRVYARDPAGNYSRSHIWRFTTRPE